MADNEKSERKEEKEQQQDIEELANWRKKIEMTGIDIKSLVLWQSLGLDFQFDYKSLFLYWV
jgi:hypothetical protein